LAQQESIYHKRWVDPWQILSWTMRQVGLSSGSAGASKKLSTERLVVVKNVEVSWSPFYTIRLISLLYSLDMCLNREVIDEELTSKRVLLGDRSLCSTAYVE